MLNSHKVFRSMKTAWFPQNVMSWLCFEANTIRELFLKQSAKEKRHLECHKKSILCLKEDIKLLVMI